MVSETRINRFPHTKPPFTIGDIKKAIPPHCFRRSLLRSSSYLLRDILLISFFYYIASNYIEVLPRPLAALAWPLYWVSQACVGFGVWALGHECCHNCFSNSSWLDDTIGLIIHSTLLTPYFSFKFSHRRHHLNINSIEREEVYPAILKSEREWYRLDKYVGNVVCRIVGFLLILVFGWYLYLCVNVLGRKYDRFASHFDPYSPIFSHRERVQIIITDAGILATIYVLYCLATAKGVEWVIYMYGIPLLVMNMVIILTTYLNHTHAAVPRYDSSEWDWLRGALGTVDMDYGFILNHVFHNTQRTHVVHHLLPSIPHYHAVEATNAIKPVLGNYYNRDTRNMIKAFWRETKQCIYVEHDEGKNNKGVLWFSNKP